MSPVAPARSASARNVATGSRGAAHDGTNRVQRATIASMSRFATPRAYNRSVDFETRAIHEGQEPDPATGALTTPIYATSTYVQEAVGKHKGYDYSRVANPTRTALQNCLASLEGAEHGVAFSSGIGAVTTLMHLVNPGERVVLIADVYGGVYRMTSQVYEPKGYVFEYLPAPDFADLGAHLDERTRIVWIETPSNPMLNVVDIRSAAEARSEERREEKR